MRRGNVAALGPLRAEALRTGLLRRALTRRGNVAAQGLLRAGVRRTRLLKDAPDCGMASKE